MVLEMILADLYATITTQLDIPTIGIGAGPDCDGQILVSYDMLGLFGSFRAVVRRAGADPAGTIVEATRAHALTRFAPAASPAARQPAADTRPGLK